jgi:Cu+-exporting ATPase
MVYSLLKENGLASYYKLGEKGIKSDNADLSEYDFLLEESVIERLLKFNESGIANITLDLPSIHCSACIYLLENLPRLDAGIHQTRVNFVTKKAHITFSPKTTSLRDIAYLLTRIGYKPRFNLQSGQENQGKYSQDKKLLYKLGLAGFAFGNIMLLSFPEYLGFDHASYLFHIGYINILLSIPVLLYSGVDYIKSAWNGLKMGVLNLDVPIALGMLTLFGRSAYEILGKYGEGYLDSFSGFVFFLLIGRWFQSFTYKALDFDRSYKSYFPLTANIKNGDLWVPKAIDQIQMGDQLLIKNNELIPVDSVLLKGRARVDYSFVTGESNLIVKDVGDKLFSGGRHQGKHIEVKVAKSLDKSYFTQLWEDKAFKNESESKTSHLINTISKYFTAIIILIAAITFIYWINIDLTKAFNATTAVLIVACPCALALALPFTYGNVLRLLSEQGLYLRNTKTIEDIQDVDTIIFDKTGTLTDTQKTQVSYYGKPLTPDQIILIKSTCMHSSHPLSMSITQFYENQPEIDLDDFQDLLGEGLIGRYRNTTVRIGSETFIFGNKKQRNKGVFVEIDGVYIGHFSFEHEFRTNLKSIIQSLKSRFRLAMLSGDNDNERDRIASLFGQSEDLFFNQTPQDKLFVINSLQDQGVKIMMVGDGLNDAGGLKQSLVGIAVTNDSNNFTPACDGIIIGDELSHLTDHFRFIKSAKSILYTSFIIAFCYNVIGLYFAISGQLSPVIAAILMPLSSITVIVFGITFSILSYKRIYK